MHVWLATQPDTSDAAWAGSTELPESDGFAGILKLSRLKADTSYFYAVSLKKKKPQQSEFHAFTTFPKPRTKASFQFAFGSCYRPTDENSGAALDELHNHIQADGLRFGMFLGDQIYADSREYNSLNHVAVTLDDYRKVYEHNWSRPAMQNLLPNLPWFMIMDDHEVDNDWCWRDLDRKWADIPLYDKVGRWFKRYPPQERHLSSSRVRAALKAYEEHQSMHAPELLMPFKLDNRGEYILKPHAPASLAYSFYCGDAAFFVMDTRTMRVRGPQKTMLGEGQLHVLTEWLKEVKDKYSVKFLVSSCSILHPLWLDVAKDRWSGFRDERERLLKFLAENEIEGVRILTGDLHSGHVVTAKLKCPSGRNIPIAEFCASPFEQKRVNLKLGYFPILSKWIAFPPKRHFYHAWPNFGVVNVNFDAPAPTVTFTLHYNYNNSEWRTKTVTA
jgi:alkaline phosphatase D